MNKRDRYAHRFYKVEVRIGNADESQVTGTERMSQNTLFGYFEGPEQADVATFVNEDGVDGQYLTVQTFNEEVLEMDELYMYYFALV